MSDNQSGGSKNGVAIVIVVLIMAMIFVYAVIAITSDSNDDRMSSHDYVLEGTHNGAPVTGQGESKYISEGTSIYLYRLTVSCSDGSSIDQCYAFDTSGNLDSSLFSDAKHIGSATVDGRNVQVWTFSDRWDGNTVSFCMWVGSYNTVSKMSISGDGWDATVYLSDPVSELYFQKDVITVSAGGAQTLTVNWYPSHAPSPQITWSSDDTSVATVSADGAVTATGSTGQSCKITATSGGCSASVTVVIVS